MKTTTMRDAFCAALEARGETLVTKHPSAQAGHRVYTRKFQGLRDLDGALLPAQVPGLFWIVGHGSIRAGKAKSNSSAVNDRVRATLLAEGNYTPKVTS